MPNPRGNPEAIKPFQWKKGVSGNPSGKPKGHKTLKEFAREYLLAMPEEDKLAFLAALPPEIVFRMAEGNPHTTVDNSIEVVQPIPILTGVLHKVIAEHKSEESKGESVEYGLDKGQNEIDPPTPLLEERESV